MGTKDLVYGHLILYLEDSREAQTHRNSTTFSAHTLTETGEKIWPLRKSLKQKVGPHSFHIHLL